MLLAQLLLFALLETISTADNGYKIVGTKIMKGSEVIAGEPGKNLRGFSISCTEYAIIAPYCWGCWYYKNCGQEGHGPTSYEEMLGNLLQWKPDIIRVPIYINPNSNSSISSGWYNREYRVILDRLIYDLRARNVVVIVDMHWCIQQTETPLPVKGCENVWADIAKAYSNDTGIWFELFNEPYLGRGHPSTANWEVWLNGNSKYVGLQTLYNAARSGADNIVLVGGLDWAYDLTKVISAQYRVQGTNLAYNSHPYANAPRKTGHSVTAAQSNWDHYFGDLTKEYPVFLTEFGQYCCPGGEPWQCSNETCAGFLPDFNEQLIKYSNQKGICWMGWGWNLDPSSMNCAYPQLAGDATGKTLFTPGKSKQSGYTCGCPDPSADPHCGCDWGAVWPSYGRR